MSARLDAGEELAPLSELARQLGVSRQRVHQLLQEGRVPGARRKGSRWKVPRAVIVGMAVARGRLDDVHPTTEDGPPGRATRNPSVRSRKEAATYDTNIKA